MDEIRFSYFHTSVWTIWNYYQNSLGNTKNIKIFSLGMLLW